MGPGFLPEEVVWQAVVKATERARKLGLCQNRIWNSAAVSERRDVDLPGLMETAQHYPTLRRVLHKGIMSPHHH
jgi:hypothetical protein